MGVLGPGRRMPVYPKRFVHQSNASVGVIGIVINFPPETARWGAEEKAGQLGEMG